MKKKPGMKNTSKIKNKSSASLAEKTEQILLTMPRIIALQLGKDLLLLKQQENKLKIDLQKAEAQKKKILVAWTAAKKKATPTAKKQSAALQKKLQKQSQLVTMFARALEALSKQAQALSLKKQKYGALQTQLLKFQNTWAKKPSAKLAKAKKEKIKNKTIKDATKMPTESSNQWESYNQSLGRQAVEVIELPDQRETT